MTTLITIISPTYSLMDKNSPTLFTWKSCISIITTWKNYQMGCSFI
jgi:hypothetical protein